MDDPERLRNLREGLLRADAQLSAFFASARDLVCELDANGVFKRLNPRWEEQLGYPLEELRESAWTEFVHPDDLAITQEALAKLEIEDTIQFENRLRHRNRSYRSFLWTATNWRAADLILAVAADLTQRREDERALHELRPFERQVIESAHEGIIILDRDFRFVVWNPFMERLSGLRAELVLGKCAPDAFSVPLDHGEYDLVRAALAGESVVSQDLGYELPGSGGAVWVSVRFSPYRSATGAIIGVIAFVQDITERRLMERELRLTHRGKDTERDKQAEAVTAYGMSPRERTILNLMAAGKSNKEIAAALGISSLTVSSHVRSILRKMHASSRAEAAARAVREALVD